MNKKQERKYKQLSFDTAVRNPYRYFEMMKIIKKYENQILSDDLIMRIMIDLLEGDFMKLKDIDDNQLKTLNKNEKQNLIIESTITRKADGGFPRGYQSRFWTYARTLCEFGLIYASYNERLLISEVSAKWLNGELSDEEVFMQQSLKYNRKSPYRRVLNDYNYFKFIVKSLQKVKRKINYFEFIISTFSRDGSVENFVNLISTNFFSTSENVVEYLKMHHKFELNKEKTFMKDYPDSVLRMLKITGLITLQYSGKKGVLIGLNFSDGIFVTEMMKNNFELNEFEKEDKLAFYQKMSKLVANMSNPKIDKWKSNSENLKLFIDSNDLKINDIISELLKLLVGKDPSNIFKYFVPYVRLEFLVSLLMQFAFGDRYNIFPSFTVDSLGAPLSHAPGGIADIKAISLDGKYLWIVEVTLIKDKTQFLNNEINSIFRHMRDEVNNKNYENSTLTIIAPYIHQDIDFFLTVAALAEKMTQKYEFNFKPYSIKEFVHDVENNILFEKTTQNTQELIAKAKNLLSNL